MTVKFKVPLAALTALVFVVAIVTLNSGNQRTKLWLSEFPDEDRYEFPKGFLWGAASAAQHIETQQNSDWTEFEIDAAKNGRSGTGVEIGVALPGHIKDIDKFDENIRRHKTNYDEVFNTDFAMASDMGHNAYRFSISWARLFPEDGMSSPDPAGVDYYNNIFNGLEQYNIQPLVSLFHFSTPVWFWDEKNGKKGWEREDAVELFDVFVSSVLENFGNRVTHWCTLNEPMTYVFNGYMQGIFPPLEQRSIFEIGPVVKNLLLAHASAYKLIHKHGDENGFDHQVGIAKHTRAFEPLRNWSILDRLSAKQIENAFVWDFFDAIDTGTLKISNTDYEVDIPEITGTQDYVGINYYGRYFVKSILSDLSNPEILFNDPQDESQMISDLGWSIYPHGFFKILTTSYDKYSKPIYVLESGIADRNHDDIRRQQFIVSHLRELWNAINYGRADIRGYMHWSLTDNFEWAEGFTARFGLISIDYENDFERKPRLSSEIYAKIIRSNSISSDINKKYSYLRKEAK